MARRDQVQRLADKLGVEFTAEPGIGFFDLWSPAGTMFSATLCHVIAMHGSVGPWTAETYDDMLESLRYGVEPCDTDGCDNCA